MSATGFAIIVFILVFVAVILAFVFIRYTMQNRSMGKLNTSLERVDKVKVGKGQPKLGSGGSVGKSRSDAQNISGEGRLNIFAASVIAVLGIIAVKVWSLQILSGSAYSKEADGNMSAESPIQAKRGRILDRNGNEMVINRASRTVIGDSTVVDNTQVVHRLSLVLGIPKEAIRARLQDSNNGRLGDRALASDVSMRAISYIAENPTAFPGVSTDTRFTRYYPYGTVGAHLLGYVGTISEEQLSTEVEGMEYASGDTVGKSGIEAAYEKALQGTKGVRTYRVNSSGEILGTISETPADAGNDIKLTVDLYAQIAAEQALADGLSHAQGAGHENARFGAIVAMDVKTGGVVAMASAPSFNPNDFTGGISADLWDSLNTTESGYPMTNRVIAGQYPAASTYKSFTGMAGLTYGLTEADTEFDCQGTWTGMGSKYPKKCWLLSGHGYQNIYDAISNSCDVYFYEIAKKFYELNDENPDALQDYLRSWGFGSVTGIDISGEMAGRVPDAEWKAQYFWETPEDAQWVPGDLANMVIGQGDVLVTPLQMVTAYAGIATGKMHKPHLLYQVLNKDGQVVISENVEDSSFKPEASDKNLQIIRDALNMAATEGGASSVFSGFPYNMAAKSGTGETGSSERDDYAWFCAYGPVEDPKYANLVKNIGITGFPTVYLIDPKYDNRVLLSNAIFGDMKQLQGELDRFLRIRKLLDSRK